MMKVLEKRLAMVLIGAFVIFSFLVFWGYHFFGAKNSDSEFVEVKKGNVVQQVSVTGKVKPAESAKLAFQNSSKVVRIDIAVGDKVYIGQVLAVLDNAEVSAQLAGVEAKLAELKKGTRAEEIQIKDVKVANTRVSLVDAKKNLVDKIKDAYIKADDAVRNKADQLFNNPTSATPTHKYTVANTQFKSDTEGQRTLVEGILDNWKISTDGISVDKNLSEYTGEAEVANRAVGLFLDKISLVVNGFTAGSEMTQAILDGYKTDISTARTNVSSATNALSVAVEKLRSAESSLALAEQELALAKAGTISEQITAQEAVVAQYQAQLSKTILRSPINGIVTKKDIELGEMATANTNVISVISESEFEMEANIPEADIAKVKVGNLANVTLDAYSGDIIFPAKVTEIEPAETMVEGVATYKTTFQFLNKDERIKSGMTANIDIMTAKKENVLLVPSRAISGKAGERFVMVDEGGSALVERKIEIGLKGVDGDTEVLSGLSEGEKIVSVSE